MHKFYKRADGYAQGNKRMDKKYEHVAVVERMPVFYWKQRARIAEDALLATKAKNAELEIEVTKSNVKITHWINRNNDIWNKYLKAIK